MQNNAAVLELQDFCSSSVSDNLQRVSTELYRIWLKCTPVFMRVQQTNGLDTRWQLMRKCRLLCNRGILFTCIMEITNGSAKVSEGALCRGRFGGMADAIPPLCVHRYISTRTDWNGVLLCTFSRPILLYMCVHRPMWVWLDTDFCICRMFMYAIDCQVCRRGLFPEPLPGGSALNPARGSGPKSPSPTDSFWICPW